MRVFASTKFSPEKCKQEQVYISYSTLHRMFQNEVHLHHYDRNVFLSFSNGGTQQPSSTNSQRRMQLINC